MKLLITPMLFSCCTVLMAQNWSPILVYEKMNFQHLDSSYISHTIWVDSAFAIEADSIFYLNRIVKDVPDNPEIVLRNQPQFLMEFIVKQIFGIYSFHYPYDYFISTGLPVGASWTFDLTNNIDAEITAYIVEEIFGVMDSVEVISLSDGSEILLSKNFGILKFPDFENGGYYELVGIQNTEYGESVPDFWNIFDFEVGDVFQKYSYYSAPPQTVNSRIKFTVNTKEIFADYINYNITRITSTYESWGYGSTHTISSYIGDLTFNIQDFQVTNNFQNDLFLLEEYGCGPNYLYPDMYTRISIYPDSLGLLTKQWGTNFGVAYVNLFYNTSPPSDTLLNLGDYECLTDQPHGVTYAESLGMTSSYYNDNFEVHDYFYLEGYVKNGDTIGTIWSDSLLTVGVESHQFNELTCFIIYPNPATDWIQIKSLNSIFSNYFSIDLRNLVGQIVLEEKNIQSQHYAMNVAGLKPGVYFYVVKVRGEVVQQGKVIKK